MFGCVLCPKGLFGVFFSFSFFFAIKICLEKFWDEGIMPCFDPI